MGGAKVEPEVSDAEIVRAVLDGETDRYAELIQRYQRRVVGVIYRQMGDYEEALDLSQEVFIKVYAALDRYDEDYRFSTWLFRIATNAAIDHLRKRRLATVPLAPSDPDDRGTGLEPASGDKIPDELVRNRELREALLAEIDDLPGDYRELIALRHFGELAYEEIATMKNLPIGTVKNKIFRARVILRERLQDFLTG